MGYSDYAPYQSAFKRKNDLDFQLRSPNGLAAQMAAARNKYGTDSKEYKAVKEKFDAIDRQYKAATSALAKIKAKIDAQAAKEKADAAKAKSTTSAKVEIPSLEAQIAAAKEQNKPFSEIKILQDKLNALKGVVSGTSTATQTPAVNNATGLQTWENYTVNTQNGNVTDKDGNVSYFIQGADSKNILSQYKSIAEARAAFLKNYKTDTQIAELKNQLVKSSYIKASQINTPDWLAGVDTMIAEYSYTIAVNGKYQGEKTSPTIASWLPTRVSAAGTSKAGTNTTPYTNLSTRVETNRQADEFFHDWLGRPATQAEKDTYFAKVNAAETAAVSKRTTTTNAKGDITNEVIQGGYLTDGDRLMIAAEVAKPVIANMDIDALSATGSKAAQYINDLKAYAASMGLPKDNRYLLQAAQNMLDTKGEGLAAEKEKIKQEAMLHFKPLASHIQAGGTIQSAAQTYQNIRSQILQTNETPVTDLTKDKDLMEAMGGGTLMSLTDWQKKMYADPRYRTTPDAHEKAASYVTTLLQAFGLMG